MTLAFPAAVIIVIGADMERETEINGCLDRLDSTDAIVRREAASRLAELGVWTRGSLRPRGRLDQPARNRLPNPRRASELISHLEDIDAEVRREVGSAIGEWGDGEAAAAIVGYLASEPDEGTRFSLVGALRTIGGPAAVEGLNQTLFEPSEALREAAMEGIADLMSGGAVDVTEDPLAAMAPSADRACGLGTRGTPRSRGTLSATESSFNVAAVAAGALNRVAEDPDAPSYLRERARFIADRIGPR